MKDNFITVHLYGGGGSRLPFILGAAEELHRIQKPDVYMGSSAGAIVAACFIHNMNVNKVLKVVGKTNVFNAYKILNQFFNPEFIPDNFYVQCTDLLTGNRVVLNAADCNSIEDYKNLVMASTVIPPIGKAKKVVTKNIEYPYLVDGGYWHSLPRIGDVFSIKDNLNIYAVSTYNHLEEKHPKNRLSQMFRANSISKQNKVLEDVDYLSLFGEDIIHIIPEMKMPSMILNSKSQTMSLYYSGKLNVYNASIRAKRS